VKLDRSSASHGFTLRQRKEKSDTEIGIHFGTTVAYRRVNLRCSTLASEVLHEVNVVTSMLFSKGRGDPNFNIACGIEGCYSTFRRFSSFTSHISRKHESFCRVQQNTECQHTQFFFVHTVKENSLWDNCSFPPCQLEVQYVSFGSVT
jgi:hypothetical protein